MKKIVVLNGSPRVNGNTAALIAEFKRGAEETGNEVTVFYLHGMNIHGCVGCCCGGKDINSPCTQKDDMELIYPKYNEADVVVIASPLYFWNFSGQLRTAFDRLFAVSEQYPHYRGPQKGAALIMAAEGYGFSDCENYYEHLLEHLDWNNIGKVLCGGVLKPGDIAGKIELRKAYELGLSIK